MAIFCGRETELRVLHEAWEAVASGAGPQAVAIVGESGYGKTRLAQEFYRRIAASSRSAEGKGYWPSDLGILDSNLQVNPPFERIDTQQVMPFMWWGIRIPDGSGRNVSLGSTVGTFAGALEPHTASIVRAGRAKQAAARMLGGVARSVVRFIPVVGQVADALDIAREARLVWGGFRERSSLAREADRPALEAARVKRNELNDGVLALMRLLLSATQDRAAVPMVWLIDDAHHSPNDPGVIDLTEKVLAAASAESWPLLIVVTHWAKEWTDHTQVPSVRAALAAARRVPTTPLDMGGTPWDALRPALAEGLPGLTREQGDALLRFVAGRPLLLEEIVRTLHGERRLFVDRNVLGPLRADALDEILANRWDLETIVAQRLKAAPDAVRQFVTLSSLQGQRLSTRLTQALADALSDAISDVAGTKEAVSIAEHPYAFVHRTGTGVAEFTQEIVFRVAERQRANDFDVDRARTALLRIIARTFGRGRPSTAADDDDPLWDDREWMLLTELAGESLTESGDPDLTIIGARALIDVVRQATRAHEPWRAAIAAKRFHEGARAGAWDVERLPFDALHDVIWALNDAKRFNLALDLIPTLAGMARVAAEHASAWTETGKIRHGLGQLPEAKAAFEAAQGALMDALAADPSADAEQRLIWSHRDLAMIAEETGDLIAVRRHLEAAVATAKRHPVDRRTASIAMSDLAMLHMERGDVAIALKTLRRTLAIQKKIAVSIDWPILWQDVGISLVRLGDAYRASGADDRALSAYRRALAIDEKLDADQSTEATQRSLGITLIRIGDRLRAGGDAEAAFPHVERAVQILERLATQLATPGSRRDLTFGLHRMGEMLRERGDSSRALACFERALSIQKQLARQVTTHQSRHDLSVTLHRIAAIHQQRGDLDRALDHDLQALALRERAAALLATPESRTALASTLKRLVSVCKAMGRVREAAEYRARFRTLHTQ